MSQGATAVPLVPPTGSTAIRGNSAGRLAMTTLLAAHQVTSNVALNVCHQDQPAAIIRATTVMRESIVSSTPIVA